jgi:cytochrome d ubiquinol oxidase subunit II
LIFVAVFMGLVSLWVPYLDNAIYIRWFNPHNFYWLLPIPLLSAAGFVLLVRSLIKQQEHAPFLYTAGLFLLGYIGLAISLWLWIVPFEITLKDAAAAPESLSLMLVGAVVARPVILGYTAFCH